jgi:hypothetical protein
MVGYIASTLVALFVEPVETSSSWFIPVVMFIYGLTGGYLMMAENEEIGL